MDNWLCNEVVFTTHALKGMISRDILTAHVLEVINGGEVIRDYTEDKPYPSRLFFKFVHGRPLHVVNAYNQIDAICVVITCYEPDPALWESDFKKKKL